MKMRKGFEYYIEKEKIREYKKWSVKEKLRWLSEWNYLRKYYPRKTIEVQEKFRRGDL